MAQFLIYGAYGYTGELAARLAVSRGQRPILAGRREDALRPLATSLGLEYRAFGLDDPKALDAGLRDIAVVLHCAGPFSHTSRAMVDACLRNRVHYLDVTGEIAVFEATARRDAEAKAGGVMLLPGVGFDVVPSDCLAAYLKSKLPDAIRLSLGLMMLGRTSHGTATTMVENIHLGGAVRKGGKITPVPAAYKQRDIDFGRGPRKAVTIPWGDVSTAYYSTGIPDIEVYLAAPAALRWGYLATRVVGPLLGAKPIQRILKSRIKAQPAGPSEVERAQGRSLLWGEVENEHGQKKAARLQGPEGYTLTAMTALAAVSKVLGGHAPDGFQTPSKAYGADFIMEIDGVTREDLAA